MNMFSGLAVGGPLDGKRIDHLGPRYRVPLPQQYFDPPMDVTSATVILVVETFDYFHYKMPSGAQLWLPECIRKGGLYEHRRYDHPMDFALYMLMRAYRPEGY